MRPSGDGGIRTRDTLLRVCQFSKLVVSATHPRHRIKSPVNLKWRLKK